VTQQQTNLPDDDQKGMKKESIFLPVNTAVWSSVIDRNVVIVTPIPMVFFRLLL